MPEQPATFNSLLRRICLFTPEQRARWDANLKSTNPEGYKKLVQYLAHNKGAVDEALGGEHWLKKLGALTFTRPFAPIQKRFIEWNWGALQKVQDKIPLDQRETVGFLPWPRETGKSSIVEWACIAEGCLLKSGYVIYLSAKLSQAIDHVVAIRDRIESEHVADLYPWMGKPKLGTHGNKFGWGQEFLMTGGGWAIRPVGADVAMRGGKSINIRPTLIVPDDYDELGDSPHIVEHKEHMLTRAILPMGNANTRVLVPQNPIHENSVVNQMLTGVSLALAIRTVFGEINEDGSMSERPIPAVDNFAYEVRQEDQGPYTVITKGESNWPGISVENWETTMNRVGPSAFLAEYQHNMTIAKEERVLPEYDDRILKLHVIMWSQFEKMYNTRRIPANWSCDLGLDLGYTAGHQSAWTFLAKAPEWVELAGSIFRYRGRTFTGVGLDEQSVAVKRDMWKDEKIERQRRSHEKLGEQITLNTMHGWHFAPCESAKMAGVPQWRHYLVCDRTQPHPFHPDKKVGGLWSLGRPAWFDIVEDDQFIAPRDDRGLKTHRDQAFKWRMRKVEDTKSGITVEQPMKKDEDTADSTRMLTAGTTFGPASARANRAQKIAALIPEGYRKAELQARTDLDPIQKAMTSQVAEWMANRTYQAKHPTPLYDEFGNQIKDRALKMDCKI